MKKAEKIQATEKVLKIMEPTKILNLPVVGVKNLFIVSFGCSTKLLRNLFANMCLLSLEMKR